jgi:hypothetical protein
MILGARDCIDEASICLCRQYGYLQFGQFLILGLPYVLCKSSDRDPDNRDFQVKFCANKFLLLIIVSIIVLGSKCSG